ncbi:MAG TPA: hypothetical protein VMY18_12525 [Acidobacteriota bacterium]|nr:hypothetical protein [Acidobacteriota bacterium]
MKWNEMKGGTSLRLRTIRDETQEKETMIACSIPQPDARSGLAAVVSSRVESEIIG